jgi:hypothetical protein
VLQQNDFSANEPARFGPNLIFTLRFPVRQGKLRRNGICGFLCFGDPVLLDYRNASASRSKALYHAAPVSSIW